jgi:steroid 5-alpha reductase family enzyme
LAVGVTVEIVADIQKTLWILRGRQGGFCAVGLWSVSRHPNYFGEIFQWWCAWLLSYGAMASATTDDNSTTTTTTSLAWGVWFVGIVSPLFTMTILLNMNATGVWAAEGKNLRRYYESEHGQAYTEYRQSTSPLIPMFGYQAIPMPIKRLLLFEWERFEYNDRKRE